MSALPRPPILRDAPGSTLRCEDTTLNWDDLLAHVHGAAHTLRARGVREGHRVAVHVDQPAAALCWFLGADLLGAASLLVESSWSARERAGILTDADVSLHVSDTPPRVGTAITPCGDGDTDFYLPTTSGSSDRPSVLVRSRASWWDSFGAFPSYQSTVDGSVLVPGPLSSSLFLFAAVHALHDGRDVRLLRRSSPEAVAGTEATATHLVPAMLAAALAVLERDRAAREACPLRLAVCGGAHTDDALRERLARVLPDCALVEYYGSSEHSVVAARKPGDGLRPVPGVSLDLRENDELWIDSPLTIRGRLDRGTLLPFPTGFSNSGDRAAQHADGTLSILGRSSTAILSTGAKLVAAEEVESVLRAAPGTRDALVLATPHPRLGSLVTAIIEVDPADPPELRVLRAHVRDLLEPAKRPRRWLTTDALPRTPSGKPARAVAAEALRSHQLDARVLT